MQIQYNYKNVLKTKNSLYLAWKMFLEINRIFMQLQFIPEFHEIKWDHRMSVILYWFHEYILFP